MATLNLSNQQVNVTTRRGQPTTVMITALDAAGEPFDLTRAAIVAKVTTLGDVEAATLTDVIAANVATLELTAAELDAAIVAHGRDDGEFVGRWSVTVQHDDLGPEPVPWLDGRFHAARYGSRTATTTNDVTVTVGATITAQLTVPGQRGPAGTAFALVEDPPGSGLYELQEVTP